MPMKAYSLLDQQAKIQKLVVRLRGTKKAYVVLNFIIAFILVVFVHFYLHQGTSSHELPSRRGFVLATHFSDQLTGSYSNLQSLQCLVGTLSKELAVVEPFLHHGSVFGVDVGTYVNTSVSTQSESFNSQRDAENSIRLSDLVDIGYWTKYGRHRDFAPLVRWEEFMDASKLQLILLDHYCDDKPGECMSCTNGYYSSDLFVSSAEKFADKYNLTIVRRACYYWSSRYSKKSFVKMAYGPFKPEESVLMINHFGGIMPKGDRFRMRVDVPQCTKKTVLMKTSTNLLSAVSEYTRKFIPEAENEGYISVMLRLQYFGIRHKFSDRMDSSQQTEEISKCLNKVLDHVADLKMEYNISTVFLATDTGKYGSLHFRESKNDLFRIGIIDKIMKNFITELFEGTVTQDELTEHIEAVIPVQSSGYVALLERHLAANGRCLVLVGGGLFQKAAYNLHQRERPGCALMNIAGC